MHNSVSNTAEASCSSDWDRGFLGLPDSWFFLLSLDDAEEERSVGDCWSWGREEEGTTCLETSKRSTRICNTNGSEVP